MPKSRIIVALRNGPATLWAAFRRPLVRSVMLAGSLSLLMLAPIDAAGSRDLRADDGVDTALIMAVDVSQSVDQERYRLQMDGIARTLEDPGVIDAITAGAKGGILYSMIIWSDQANFAIGWRRIFSREDALKIAAEIRDLPQQGGEFTCVARMLRTVSVSIIPNIPIPANRVVLDVSSDGIDNCNDYNTLHSARDSVLATGATINGLPIIVEGENEVVGSGAYRAPGFGLRELSRRPDQERTTLDRWFNDHVVGGPGAFLLTAKGYSDFARALRQKFVIEVAGGLPARLAHR